MNTDNYNTYRKESNSEQSKGSLVEEMNIRIMAEFFLPILTPDKKKHKDSIASLPLHFPISQLFIEINRSMRISVFCGGVVCDLRVMRSIL